MWCDNCEHDPCSCQRAVGLAAKPVWVVRACQGCHRAVIRERIDQVKADECKWCQAKAAGISVIPTHCAMSVD